MTAPTWYAVYVTETGTLVSVGTAVADPLPEELTAVALGPDAPDLGQLEWHVATRTFVPRAVEPILSVVDFRERFTFQERVAIKMASMADAEVAVLMEDVGARDVIHLDDPRTIAGVQMLASKALIAVERIEQILGTGA